MSKNLVIVESPAKAKTINKILGKDYTVKASMGHIRDLPQKELGVDLENNFKPKYISIKGREKIVKELKDAAKDAEHIYLAPDPDREGEAIAWHLVELLKNKKDDLSRFFRVTYNEITAPAIRKAFNEPRQIDTNKVDSQQARRILDRIVGYKISPLLWRRIRGATSAGRVQTVALRLVCEREREILNFKPEEYWLLGAKVRKQVDPKDPFEIRLAKINDDKAEVKSAEQSHAIRADLEGRTLRVKNIIRREISKRPQPSYITSTLQQAASSVFGFTPSRTMKIAQKLYEGVDFGEGPVGLITYMRTDSVSISAVAQQACREYVVKQFGAEYIPEKPHVYKSRSGAQEAHEAIRPTEVSRTAEQLSSVLDADEMKLYRLIWQRFVASQMAAAKIAQRTAEIEAEPTGTKKDTYLFRASTSDILFPGYMKVTGGEARKEEEKKEEGEDGETRLPPLTEGEALDHLEWLEERKETMPPPRYTEASLIKRLEEDGVGRPSTYAQIMSTLLNRSYVEKDKRALRPTGMGLQVNDYLIAHLSELFDVKFTAGMEESLDKIESGEVEWTKMLSDFYETFQKWAVAAKGPPVDPKVILRLAGLLEQVQEWKPEMKRGKRTYSDKKFVDSVKEQLDDPEKPISDRQLQALVKLVAEYKKQLPTAEDIIKELGLEESMQSYASQAEPPSAQTLRKLELLGSVTFAEPRQIGKRIFDDKVFFESLRGQVQGGKNLSPNQMQYLDKLFFKYGNQIPNFEAIAAELGVSQTQEEGDKQVGPLLDLMKNIKEWKPAVMRGKRSWDDKVFFESLSQQFAVKKQLSFKQSAALKKMVRRYGAQIPNYDQLVETMGLLPLKKKKEEADGEDS